MDTFTTPSGQSLYTPNTIPDMGLHMVEKEKKREILMRGSTDFSYAVPTDSENKVRPSPKKFKDIDKEELKRLYLDEKLSCNEIAPKYPISAVSIRNWLIRINVELRDYSESRKGIRSSPQTEFKKGMEPWNKGKEGCFSKESLEKMSKSHKGNSSRPQLCNLSKVELEYYYLDKKMCAREIGEMCGWGEWIVLSALRRFNISRRDNSEAGKGRKAWNETPAPKKEILENLYIEGEKSVREIGEEFNVSFDIARGWLRKYNIPIRSASERNSKPSKKRWENPEYRKKIVDHITERWQDEDYRQMMSDIHKDKWNNPEFVKKIMTSQKRKPNKSEYELDALLQDCFPNQWKYAGDGKEGITIGGKLPDWIDANGKKRVIELFGEPFHSNLIAPNIKVPYRKTYKGTMEHYKKHGYKCLIIWSRELKNPDKVLEKLRNFT